MRLKPDSYGGEIRLGKITGTKEHGRETEHWTQVSKEKGEKR